MSLLYIFDKDGTICTSRSGEKFINSADDQILLPNVAEICDKLSSEGHTLAVASNQGGVAFGIMSEDTAEAIVAHAAGLINADSWIICPHHPNGNNSYAIDCNCRKPGPGMINHLMDDLGYHSSEIVFVGDRPEDRQAAANAGIQFIWAKDFFTEEK